MGTVINDRPDFYQKCIKALENLGADVIISCGNATDRKALGTLPDHIQVYPYVNQLEVLSRADVFITHCGMNSVSESLYMAAPMVLYPQTNEQKAVARRVTEIGAGIVMKDDSVNGIRTLVEEVLANDHYAKAAEECGRDFRSCSGAAGAAQFIEEAPHVSAGIDVIDEMNRRNNKFQLVYWLTVTAVIWLTGILISWKYVWMIGLGAALLSGMIGKSVQNRNYAAVIRKLQK
jgi:hypothetical protein